MKNIKAYEEFFFNNKNKKKLQEDPYWEEFEVTPSKEVAPDVIQKFQLNISAPRNFNKEIYRIAAENKVQVSNIKPGHDVIGKEIEIYFTGIEKNAEAFVHDVTISTGGAGRGNVEFWTLPN